MEIPFKSGHRLINAELPEDYISGLPREISGELVSPYGDSLGHFTLHLNNGYYSESKINLEIDKDGGD